MKHGKSGKSGNHSSKPKAAGKSFRGGIRSPSETGENRQAKPTGNGNFHKTADKVHPVNNERLQARIMRGGIRF